MTFTLVGSVIEGVLKARDTLATFMDNLYLQTIMQVHVSGNHDDCSSSRCYDIEFSEFKKHEINLRFSTLSGDQVKIFLKTHKKFQSKSGKEVLKKLETLGSQLSSSDSGNKVDMLVD